MSAALDLTHAEGDLRAMIRRAEKSGNPTPRQRMAIIEQRRKVMALRKGKNW